MIDFGGCGPAIASTLVCFDACLFSPGLDAGLVAEACLFEAAVRRPVPVVLLVERRWAAALLPISTDREARDA